MENVVGKREPTASVLFNGGLSRWDSVWDWVDVGNGRLDLYQNVKFRCKNIDILHTFTLTRTDTYIYNRHVVVRKSKRNSREINEIFIGYGK